MRTSKFKKGDKVRVVKYGHPVWSYDNMETVFPIISENKEIGFKIYDMHSELVGQTGTVSKVTKIQGQFEYSLEGIPSKTAWYDEEQLERILPSWKDKTAWWRSIFKKKSD